MVGVPNHGAQPSSDVACGLPQRLHTWLGLVVAITTERDADTQPPERGEQRTLRMAAACSDRLQLTASWWCSVLIMVKMPSWSRSKRLRMDFGNCGHSDPQHIASREGLRCTRELRTRTRHHTAPALAHTQHHATSCAMSNRRRRTDTLRVPHLRKLQASACGTASSQALHQVFRRRSCTRASAGRLLALRASRVASEASHGATLNGL